MLTDLPLLSDKLVLYAHYRRDDLVLGVAIPRYPPVDNHMIFIRHNRAGLVPQRRGGGPDEFKETVAASRETRGVENKSVTD